MKNYFRDKIQYLKLELNSLKEKLEPKADKDISHLESLPESTIISFNIGGKSFNFFISSILSVPDSLFLQLIKKLPLHRIQEEIFIDRSPRNFEPILEYYQTKQFPRLKYLSEYKILLEEAKFYNVIPIIEFAFKQLRPVHYVSFICEPKFCLQGFLVGEKNAYFLNNFEDRSLSKGILVGYTGFIEIEFDKEIFLEELEIGKYIPKIPYYNPYAGVKADIFTKPQNEVQGIWTFVGVIPNEFMKEKIVKIKLKPTFCKHIKFMTLNSLSIGYLQMIRK